MHLINLIKSSFNEQALVSVAWNGQQTGRHRSVCFCSENEGKKTPPAMLCSSSKILDCKKEKMDSVLSAPQLTLPVH